MASFQVVAVGRRTGTRFPIRDPHGSWIAAEWHRAACAASFPEEVYSIDACYADGESIPWTRDVDGVRDLGYPQEEVDSIREWGLEHVARQRGTVAT